MQLQESQEDSIQWKWSEKSDGVISELVVLCLGLGFFSAVVVSCVRGVIYVPLFSPLSRVSGVYWGLFCVFAWVSCLGVGCFALVFVYFLLSQSLVVSVPHVSVCPFSSFPFYLVCFGLPCVPPGFCSYSFALFLGLINPLRVCSLGFKPLYKLFSYQLLFLGGLREVRELKL